MGLSVESVFQANEWWTFNFLNSKFSKLWEERANLNKDWLNCVVCRHSIGQRMRIVVALLLQHIHILCRWLECEIYWIIILSQSAQDAPHLRPAWWWQRKGSIAPLHRRSTTCRVRFVRERMLKNLVAHGSREQILSFKVCLGWRPQHNLASHWVRGRSLHHASP